MIAREGKICCPEPEPTEEGDIPWSHMCLNSVKLSVYRCSRRNVPDFRRVFLMLKYTDVPQNTYIQS